MSGRNSESAAGVAVSKRWCLQNLLQVSKNFFVIQTVIDFWVMTVQYPICDVLEVTVELDINRHLD